MTFQEFKASVEQWAQDRGIYEHSTALAQCLKAVSELGELADHAIKGDRDAMKDDIGDIAVCLVNVARMEGVGIGAGRVNNHDRLPKEVAVASCAKAISDLTLMVGIYQAKGCAPTGIGAYGDLPGQLRYAFGHLVMIADECGFTIEECCEHAWREIKDRKGRMVPGGAFVKEGEEMSNNTGGPAFPESGARGMAAGGEGMSLRDYFAAKAVSAVWNRLSDMPLDYAADFTAEAAYKIADAMLKEREK